MPETNMTEGPRTAERLEGTAGRLRTTHHQAQGRPARCNDLRLHPVGRPRRRHAGVFHQR